MIFDILPETNSNSAHGKLMGLEPKIDPASFWGTFGAFFFQGFQLALSFREWELFSQPSCLAFIC